MAEQVAGVADGIQWRGQNVFAVGMCLIVKTKRGFWIAFLAGWRCAEAANRRLWLFRSPGTFHLAVRPERNRGPLFDKITNNSLVSLRVKNLQKIFKIISADPTYFIIAF